MKNYLTVLFLLVSVLADAQSVVQIPTVFHVLWNEPSDNIPDSLILQTLELVNKDFRRQNEDTVLTPDRFLPLAADTEIEFVLTTTDPDGNPTDGITTSQTDSVRFHYNHESMKFDSTGGKNGWNACSYLNVWVVPELGSGFAVLEGTATYPGGDWDSDGVVVWHRMMELDMDGSYRSVTRLFAQYLNLYYISNSSCLDSDSVSDTPNSSWEPLGLQYNCDDTIATCPNGVDGDMFMNFMSNRFETCANMFTIGQKDRMHATLANERLGLIDPTLCGLSVRNIELERMKVFPNPAHDQLNFQSLEKGTLSVLELSGRTVLTSLAVKGQNTIDVCFLPDGVYLLQLQTETSVSSARFVKKSNF